MTNRMASGVAWVVVESLPVSENIKKQKATGAHLGVGAFHRAHQTNYTDMRSLLPMETGGFSAST